MLLSARPSTTPPTRRLGVQRQSKEVALRRLHVRNQVQADPVVDQLEAAVLSARIVDGLRNLRRARGGPVGRRHEAAARRGAVSFRGQQTLREQQLASLGGGVPCSSGARKPLASMVGALISGADLQEGGGLADG